MNSVRRGMSSMSDQPWLAPHVALEIQGITLDEDPCDLHENLTPHESHPIPMDEPVEGIYICPGIVDDGDDYASEADRRAYERYDRDEDAIREEQAIGEDY